MENAGDITEALAARSTGTYDFGSPIELVKAMDLGMRHYFGAEHWLIIRDRLFPGLRTKV